METTQIVLMIVGFFALFGVIAYLGHLAEKKRTAAMKSLAEMMGYRFEEIGDQKLADLSGFELFQKGHGRTVKNVITGRSSGFDFSIFDYRYTTGSGKNRNTWHQTVAHVKSDRLKVPTFAMRPENLFHKLGSAFGYQDIDFDSHETFSKKFLLRGQPEEEVRTTFQPHVLDYFESNLGVCVEGFAGELVFYKASTKVAPERVRGHLEKASEIHNLFAR